MRPSEGWGNSAGGLPQNAVPAGLDTLFLKMLDDVLHKGHKGVHKDKDFFLILRNHIKSVPFLHPLSVVAGHFYSEFTLKVFHSYIPLGMCLSVEKRPPPLVRIPSGCT